MGWSDLRTEKARENNRRASREAKRRRTGRCVDCGATTQYDGRGAASERCVRCAAVAQKPLKQGRGVFVEAALAEMRKRPCRAHDLADAALISVPYARCMIHRLVGYGLIERVGRGVYRATEHNTESRGE